MELSSCFRAMNILAKTTFLYSYRIYKISVLFCGGFLFVIRTEKKIYSFLVWQQAPSGPFVKKDTT